MKPYLDLLTNHLPLSLVKLPRLLMNQNLPERARDTLEAIYRDESRRVLATLIRLLGDFDLAEEALHDAVTAAMEQWPRKGVPASPQAWLVSTGRFKAIDRIRRRARFDASLEEAAEQLQTQALDPRSGTMSTSKMTGCG